MATAAGYFDRTPNPSTRPGLSHLQADPSLPHTPQRTFSSAFSSPSLSYRAEEEVLVFELGARHLSAGIAGESNPRCRLGFGPEDSRRVGDYRSFYPEYHDRPRKRKRDYKWGEDHELWRMDLRGVNLGLVEDKIERAVREAYTKYLLLDSKNKRLVLVLPSLMPHRLLSSVLTAIFDNFQTPSITLFSSPALNVMAAGCRAGLVVDIGWDETIITGVYDFREILVRRTTKAMKHVTRCMAELLKGFAEPEASSAEKSKSLEGPEKRTQPQLFSDSRYFDFAEEVTSRIAWCPVEERKAESEHDSSEAEANDPIFIPSPLPPRKTLKIPFTKLPEPVETGLLAAGNNLRYLDDHEQPLTQLIYDTLLSLPSDVRSACMARIIITGGGSNIAGLKTRLLSDLSLIIKSRGWNPVYGRAAEQVRQLADNPKLEKPTGPQTMLEPQISDEITEKLDKEKMKRLAQAEVAREVRGVETLGAWAGGSLVASLKIKGVVEIDRDSFLATGLAGAKGEHEIAAATQRITLGPRTGVGEKSGWTLGTWA
ncbi:MAG: hypothetical protein L6R40_006717 [Gallowayella cf. fulva]|nr:MAG: hypothetical protein L6R40_006717 [Xanthomendoza cf. fulva]